MFNTKTKIDLLKHKTDLFKRIFFSSTYMIWCTRDRISSCACVRCLCEWSMSALFPSSSFSFPIRTDVACLHEIFSTILRNNDGDTFSCRSFFPPFYFLFFFISSYIFFIFLIFILFFLVIFFMPVSYFYLFFLMPQSAGCG